MRSSTTGLKRPRFIEVLLVLTAAASLMVLAACGDSTSVSTDETVSAQAEQSEESAEQSEESVAFVPTHQASEQDIELARAEQSAAQRQWDEAARSDYMFDVGLQPVSMFRIEVVGGEAVSEEMLLGSASSDGLPRTIDEVFVVVDGLIADFENGSVSVDPAGGCDGHSLNVRYDPELGYPTYYDTLGPCEDGLGISVILVE